MKPKDLNNILGNIDLYLLDQLLKGRFTDIKKILDAGCGEGRNIKYFIQQGFEVHGIDRDPMAIRMLRMANKSVRSERFQIGDLSELPYEDAYFEACICSAVLHFASGRDEFLKMCSELCRIIQPGGLLFIRMATVFGIREQATFPYLLSEPDMAWIDERFTWIEPFKTVLVEDRSMGVCVLGKK